MTASHGSGSLNSVSMSACEQFSQTVSLLFTAAFLDLTSQWSARGPFRTRTGGGRAGALLKHPRACYMAWEPVMRPNTDCARWARVRPKTRCTAKQKQRARHRLLAPENTRQLGHAHSQKLVQRFDWCGNGIENSCGDAHSERPPRVDLDLQRKLNAFEFIALYVYRQSHTERSVCRDDWSLSESHIYVYIQHAAVCF